MQRRFHINPLREYNTSDIIHRLQKYFKFLVVRHPLDRLVSAYIDKLVHDNHVYQTSMGTDILKRYRISVDNKTLEQGKGVRFSEYIRYIIEYMPQDGHFTDMQSQCFPCEINYNYIAKLETQNSDALHIINEKLSGYGSDALYNVHHTGGGAHLGKELSEFENITAQELEDLSYIFYEDLDIFGYSFDRNQRSGVVKALCGQSSSQYNCC